MKFNAIPYVIIAAFVLFAIYIGQFVYRSSQSDVNLVSKDYYAKDVAYQQEYNILEASLPYDSLLTISHDKTEKRLQIQFPLALKIESGEVEFFRPSSNTLDQKIEVVVNAENVMKLQTSQMPAGLWYVNISCKANGNSYLFKRKIEF